MALSLLISTLGRKKAPEIDRIQLDAFISEEITRSQTLTSHPIESGESITDSVIKIPDTLSVSGSVTDAPVVGFSLATQVFSILSVLGTGRIKTAEEGLNELFENPRPITITSPRRAYKDMIMTDLTFPNDADTGNKLDFTATFQKVRIVETLTRLLTPEEKQQQQNDIVEGNKQKTTAAAEKQKKLADGEPPSVGFKMVDGASGGKATEVWNANLSKAAKL